MPNPSDCLAAASRAVLCASIPLLIGAQAAEARPATDRMSQAVRQGPAAIAAVRQAIFEAEERRAPTEADLKVLAGGTRHPNESVQRMAVRALGRLERPELIAEIEPMLSSPFAPVRAAAADALGQAVSRGPETAVAQVQAILLKRLGAERDVRVASAIYQTLGRVPYGSAQAARSAEVALLVALLPIDSRPGLPVELQISVAKGFEALLRRNAKLFTPSAETVRRLRQLAVDRPPVRESGEIEKGARVRRLAMAALGSAKQADEATIARAAGDPDAQVRRLAIVALAAMPPASTPEAARAKVMSAALADRDQIVRYEALRIHARALSGGSADWAPVFAALEDPSPHVALLAIDLLWGPQPQQARAVEALRREVETLPAASEAAGRPPAARIAATSVPEWHRAAHALVSLARIAPETAREYLPRFLASTIWPVRTYAARAAALLRDVDALKRLAADEHDNVSETALGGLKTVAGHDADGLYLEALGRSDYQLIMSAVNALTGTPRRAEAVAAFAAALSRITAQRRDTSRDVRLTLIGRISELGQPSDAPALASYTSDFDPRVASEAAAAIGKLAGQTPAVDPRPIPIAASTLADVERLRGARAVVRVAGRGTFEVELLPDEAPATVARFVALAKAGYYNGLTFHRVVPNFVVQGGSPGANEYMGDGPFMRDEIGLEPHVRGAAGISTRGRDTGDAQIWFDLVDNPRLDHDYTVFGRVVSGADVLDRILEFDIIDRIEIQRVGNDYVRDPLDDDNSAGLKAR